MNIHEAGRLGPKGTAARLRFEAALEHLRKAAKAMEDAGQEPILIGNTGSGDKCIMPIGSRCRIEYRPARGARR
ncbi:hypothetical protein [uncultured Salinicola sp.]|uniref:hypothetical protein n=1 Tax=uncultured Salinicola sp. TaxID=1193542 RepID=UPI002618C1F7|nr:hypothetical protein [uncultured Salinicola sp.]|tara:strand:+ start:5710 stop:5931 length:222 start_codon:yes stop_codon:yes gene_type:complete